MDLVLTRQEALDQGLSRYLGPPCKYGHHEGRVTNTYNCVICLRNQKNAYQKRRYHADPIRAKREYRTWVENNPEKRRNYIRQWNRDNPDRVALYDKRRRGKHLTTLGNYSKEIRALHRAAKRKSSDDVKYVVDHIYPINGIDSCGLHVPWNMQVIPSDENGRKYNKSPEDFYGLTSYELHEIFS